jgi:hypothetical protein
LCPCCGYGAYSRCVELGRGHPYARQTESSRRLIRVRVQDEVQDNGRR